LYFNSYNGNPAYTITPTISIASPVCPRCCSQAGICQPNGTCDCSPSFTGSDCSTPICQSYSTTFCKIPGPFVISPALFSQSNGLSVSSSCSLNETVQALDQLFGELFFAESSFTGFCASMLSNLYCSVYFLPCQGAQLTVACPSACTNFNNQCGSCISPGSFSCNGFSSAVDIQDLQTVVNCPSNSTTGPQPTLTTNSGNTATATTASLQTTTGRVSATTGIVVATTGSVSATTGNSGNSQTTGSYGSVTTEVQSGIVTTAAAVKGGSSGITHTGGQSTQGTASPHTSSSTLLQVTLCTLIFACTSILLLT